MSKYRPRINIKKATDPEQHIFWGRKWEGQRLFSEEEYLRAKELAFKRSVEIRFKEIMKEGIPII
jgi:hypothetical protein